jgi:hypothetical protein
MHRENEADHKQQEKEEVNACSSIPSSSLSLSLLPAPSVPESGASLIAQHLQIDEENEEKKKHLDYRFNVLPLSPVVMTKTEDMRTRKGNKESIHVYRRAGLSPVPYCFFLPRNGRLSPTPWRHEAATHTCENGASRYFLLFHLLSASFEKSETRKK